METDVVVIGAGPAGLLGAAECARRGRRTVLLEKGPKAGVKILMSGGTRCNLTQHTDRQGIERAFGGAQGRFLRAALAALDPPALVALFEAEGVPTKVEPTGKVFPQSDRALDVQRALLRRLERSGARLRLGTPVRELVAAESGYVVRLDEGELHAEHVLVTAGGKSYAGCGTTGDAYAWLARLGHTIVAPRPALVPITSDAAWVAPLQGVTLVDALVRVVPREAVSGDDPAAWSGAARKRQLAERRGSVLLTHLGLSGPAIMDVSRAVTACPDPRSLAVTLDLLPDETFDALDESFRAASAQRGGGGVSRLLPVDIPKRLGATLLMLAGADGDRPAAELPKAARRRLAGLLKCLVVPVTGVVGFDKAEVTAGGVDLREIDPQTMESRKAPGLFVAGELLDLDGPIGGYNFQAAFSTGWLAGHHA